MSLPVTEEILKTCLRLQINEALEPDDIREVARRTREVAKFYRKA